MQLNNSNFMMGNSTTTGEFNKKSRSPLSSSKGASWFNNTNKIISTDHGY